MGVATGCGCKGVYRFPHTILIPTPLVSVFFTAASLLFSSFFLMFFVLVPVLFCNAFYVLNFFLRSINTHTGNYGRPTAAI